MSLTVKSTSSLTAEAEAIRHLKRAILSGEHWYIALLEAMGLWTKAEETHNGRTYSYLIADEAFDWLLLAERLCESVESLLPEEEKISLLFYGHPPIQLTIDRFKELIGPSKYQQYLNYFYGVMVEEFLFITVQEEVRKERWTAGYSNEYDISDEVFQRIYEATKNALLKRFRREKGYPQRRSITLTGLKEFTYWLFKYRLQECDKAKVASDTKKALKRLKQSSAFTPYPLASSL